MANEDKFIYGEKGFWYVWINEYCMAGYFHTLKNARRHVRYVMGW